MKLEQEIDIASIPARETTSGDYAPLPEGWYSARIVNAEVRDTKSGTGKYIAVRYDITGPTNAGRVVWGNLNTKNQNPKAEEIGRQQMGDLMRAVGLAKLSDTDQLIGCEVKIKLAIRKSDQYGDGNEVKGWNAASETPKLSQMPATSPKPVPPWAKK